MTGRMHDFEKDGAQTEACPLCQENTILREGLTKVTEQLAKSEERRISLLQELNEMKFELVRIRDENDFLKQVVSPCLNIVARLSSRDVHASTADTTKKSDTNLSTHNGQADLMEVTANNCGMESTEERKGPCIRIGGYCEKKGAAEVHIANDSTK
ncbi:hypothetical protein LTR49_028557 [Elasticomyces elasticus]|nr:hypothetical protein LTR49_028557 [Elasticomyces elasticus]